jgi:hypothetical protein
MSWEFSSLQRKGRSARVKPAICRIRAIGLLIAALACLIAFRSAEAQTGGIEENFANSLTAIPAENLSVSGSFYVPVYSSVSMSQGKLRADFSVIALRPFATVEVSIATSDVRGGTGANFLVDWAATGEIAEPAVEALMVGSVGPGHYAFVSQGRPMRIIGKN